MLLIVSSIFDLDSFYHSKPKRYEMRTTTNSTEESKQFCVVIRVMDNQ